MRSESVGVRVCDSVWERSEIVGVGGVYDSGRWEGCVGWREMSELYFKFLYTRGLFALIHLCLVTTHHSICIYLISV